jgi:hypothetical protein
MLWRAVGHLVSDLCERDFAKSLGYMSVLSDKWREGPSFSLASVVAPGRCAASASPDSGVRLDCLTTSIVMHSTAFRRLVSRTQHHSHQHISQPCFLQTRHLRFTDCSAKSHFQTCRAMPPSRYSITSNKPTIQQPHETAAPVPNS